MMAVSELLRTVQFRLASDLGSLFLLLLSSSSSPSDYPAESTLPGFVIRRGSDRFGFAESCWEGCSRVMTSLVSFGQLTTYL